MAEEHVLVIPTAELRRVGLFQGFRADVDSYLPLLHDPQFLRFEPRSAMERDPEFKQLIPYVVLVHGADTGSPSVYAYTRGSGQGESRLHRLRSVGVGGHISREDDDSGDPFETGLRRELEEELIIGTSWTGGCVGLINDDSNDVGRVHLGIVHRFDLASDDVRPREAELVDAGFVSVAQAKQELERFETWSRICLEHLFPG
ncbi:MAG TPA: phosphoesterase [Planctomycetaceae bacterium]|nr:phosphoesterase [Planctomycetaceae bacterium]HRE99895.1 phosphoesterase [Pirellulaceae bacterium]